MKKQIIVWITYFLSAHSLYAQTSNTTPLPQKDPNKKELTADYLNNRLGTGWLGIIFICDPYCEAVSIKVDKSWQPSLKGLPFKESHLKTVAQTDPLYPLLFDNAKGQLLANESIQLNSSNDRSALNRPLPPYAQSPFNFGYAIYTGFSMVEGNFYSNSQIQSELQKVTWMHSMPLRISLMKGSPIALWETYWQLLFDYETKTVDPFTIPSSTQTLSLQEDTTQLRGILMLPSVRGFLTYTQVSQLSQPSGDSLTLYPQLTNRSLLTLGLLWRRYLLEYGKSLNTTIQETQSFRIAPIIENFQLLRLSHYSNNFTVFDYELGFYVVIEGQAFQQNSQITSRVFSQAHSEFKDSLRRIEFGLRFGEDLFQ